MPTKDSMAAASRLLTLYGFGLTDVLVEVAALTATEHYRAGLAELLADRADSAAERTRRDIDRLGRCMVDLAERARHGAPIVREGLGVLVAEARRQLELCQGVLQARVDSMSPRVPPPLAQALSALLDIHGRLCRMLTAELATIISVELDSLRTLANWALPAHCEGARAELHAGLAQSTARCAHGLQAILRLFATEPLHIDQRALLRALDGVHRNSVEIHRSLRCTSLAARTLNAAIALAIHGA